MNDLPKGWEITPLSEVGDLVSGAGFPEKLQYRKGQLYPFFKVGNLGKVDSGKPLIESEHTVGDEIVRLLKAQVIPINSIVFAKIGMAIRLNRRRLIGIPSCIDNNLMAVLPSEIILPRYLLRFLETLDFMPLTKATTVPALRKSELEILEVPLAPLNEQRRIVEKLEKLLGKVDDCQKRLEKIPLILKRFRQSVLAAACSGRLTADWREENLDTELSNLKLTPSHSLFHSDKVSESRNYETCPELPGTWTFTSIESLLSNSRKGIKTGPFGTMLKKSEHQPDGIPVLGIENIGFMMFRKGTKIHITAEKAKELSEYETLPGDVLISRSGTVGEVCVVPDDIGEARISTNLMRVVLTNQVILSMFFCYLFNGSPFVLSQVKELCKGSTRDFLNQTILKAIVFPLPPQQEQIEIVRRVEALFKLADQIESRYNKAKAYVDKLAQSILAKAFRGDLVPQDPDDEPASVLLERIRSQRATSETTNKNARPISNKKKQASLFDEA